jgi:hypothetical protein
MNALALRLRRRAADESGFTMIVAMMVLMIVTLLIGAAFVAANGDVENSRHDVDAKRAYYSARAGLSRFLFELNKNNEAWQTCPAQTTTTLPGSGGQTYSYAPLPANGQSACTTINPVGTFIDIATGSFRMRFTGTSNGVSRSIVAQFKRRSPLDYLYYSKYETLDPNTYQDPSNYQDCAAFIRDNRPFKCGYIQWVTGDDINGPLYTQDQYVICGSPVFGRPGKTDTVQSAATTPTIEICGGNPTYNTPTGGPLGDAGTIDPPADNTNLLPYAQSNGRVYTGKTVITLNGTSASISNASVAGLVANNFIRVMHGVGPERTNGDPNNCNGAANLSGYTHTGMRIDAAILALQHSFIVDNYDCGAPITGDLNVNGAIAQIFRGTVGTGGGGSINSGYLKNYNYDDRLAVLQPPYLFDLSSSAWRVIRETSCTPGSTDPSLAC